MHTGCFSFYTTWWNRKPKEGKHERQCGNQRTTGANINTWWQTCAEHVRIASHQLLGWWECDLLLALLNLPCHGSTQIQHVLHTTWQLKYSCYAKWKTQALCHQLPPKSWNYWRITSLIWRDSNLTHKTEITPWQSHNNYLLNCLCIVTNLSLASPNICNWFWRTNADER